jgi:hypothetical protein
MKIKWEKNSRSKGLADEGKIKSEDVIEKTTTDNFPAECATVRMGRPKDKTPSVTLHIRGKSVKGRYGNGAYECANTCRVNLSNDWKTGTMNSNGDLDEDYTWQDVHDAVEKVKEVMSL